MALRVLVMAGGTGGHVFPALAIVKALQAQGHEVQWLGTRGRIEERVVPAAGITIHYIDVKGVRRNGLASLLKAPFMVTRAIAQAKQVITQFAPDVVIGFGGYASGPGGVAAYLSGIPLILHEQNAAAGLTNRILAKFAQKILLGVGQAFSGPKVEAVGNPVRADIAQLYQEERSFHHADGKLHILIIGGSLGAQALNERVPEALKLFEQNEIVVVHQCGQGQSAATAQRYEGASFHYETSDFIQDMAAAYRQADLIICRAGASTISELSAVKLPAILVPLPTAVDDHQTKNALTLVNAGAAQLIAQQDLTAQRLHDTIAQIMPPQTLAQMSQAAASLEHLNATQRVCAVIEQLAAARHHKK